MGKIISIFSPKGGVGKTTLTLALAEVLQKEGKTLVIEFDFSPGDFATLLDVDKTKNIELAVVYGLSSAVQKPEGKEYFVVAGGFPETHEKINAEQIKNLLSEARNNFDFILFDIQPGLVERSIDVLNNSDKVLVIIENNQYVILRFARIIRYISTRIEDLSKVFIVVNKANPRQKICIPDEITGEIIPWCSRLHEPWDRKIVFHVERLKQKLLEHRFTDTEKLIEFTNEILRKHNINVSTQYGEVKDGMIYIMTNIQSLDDLLKNRFTDFVTDDISKSRIQVLMCEDKQKIDEAARIQGFKIVLTSYELERYAYEKGFEYVFAGAIEIPKITHAIEDLISRATAEPERKLIKESKSEQIENPEQVVEPEQIEEKPDEDSFSNPVEDSEEELFAQDLKQEVKNIEEKSTATEQTENMQDVEVFISNLSSAVTQLISTEVSMFLKEHSKNMEDNQKLKQEITKLLEENQKLKERIAELEEKLKKLNKIKELITSLAGGLDE